MRRRFKTGACKSASWRNADSLSSITNALIKGARLACGWPARCCADAGAASATSKLNEIPRASDKRLRCIFRPPAKFLCYEKTQADGKPCGKGEAGQKNYCRDAGGLGGAALCIETLETCPVCARLARAN